MQWLVYHSIRTKIEWKFYPFIKLFFVASQFFFNRNEFYFCGFYRCVNSGETLTNWVKPEGFYVKFWVIRRRLHIDKIHQNNNSFRIIPTLPPKSYFCRYIVHFRGRRKENSSGIPAHGIYPSVKLFLQPIKFLKMSIVMRSWNYWTYDTVFIVFHLSTCLFSIVTSLTLYYIKCFNVSSQEKRNSKHTWLTMYYIRPWGL